MTIHGVSSMVDKLFMAIIVGPVMTSVDDTSNNLEAEHSCKLIAQTAS